MPICQNNRFYSDLIVGDKSFCPLLQAPGIWQQYKSFYNINTIIDYVSLYNLAFRQYLSKPESFYSVQNNFLRYLSFKSYFEIRPRSGYINISIFYSIDSIVLLNNSFKMLNIKFLFKLFNIIHLISRAFKTY